MWNFYSRKRVEVENLKILKKDYGSDICTDNNNNLKTFIQQLYNHKVDI